MYLLFLLLIQNRITKKNERIRLIDDRTDFKSDIKIVNNIDILLGFILREAQARQRENLIKHKRC